MYYPSKSLYIHEHPPKKKSSPHAKNAEDVLSFNSAISACEKSMEWRWALELLKDGADFTEKNVGESWGKG